MRSLTRIAIPVPLAATLRCLRSLATCLALPLASFVVLEFLCISGFAQGQGPNLGDSIIPKPIMDTIERVRMRDAPLNAPVKLKAVDTEGACLLPPLTQVHSPTVVSTALQIPEKAKREYGQACAELKRKKFEKAEKHLRNAVQEYPKYAVPWVTLGQILAAQDKIDEARSACFQSSSVEPGYLPSYLCLADLAARRVAHLFCLPRTWRVPYPFAFVAKGWGT